MHRDDEIRLRHMLEAAEDALRFVESRERESLDADRLLVYGLLKCIEIIGEAAGRVSAGFRQSTSMIPWSDIIGMRNRLVHGYFEVDLDRVWDTVVADLPPLVKELEALLSED